MDTTLVSREEAASLARHYWRAAQALGWPERLATLYTAQRFAYLARGYSTEEIAQAVPAYL